MDYCILQTSPVPSLRPIFRFFGGGVPNVCVSTADNLFFLTPLGESINKHFVNSYIIQQDIFSDVS